MNQSNINYKLGVLCLIALIGCEASHKGAEQLAPDGESGLLSSEGDVESAFLEEGETEGGLEENEESRRIRIKANDKKFIENFKLLSKEEKIRVVKSLKKTIKGLLSLSPEERKTALSKMEPPMPSRKVLKKLFKKNDATLVQ